MTLCALLALGLSPGAPSLSAECYARVAPALERAGGKFTPEAKAAYLSWAESEVQAELQQAKQSVPADCLAEVDLNPTVRDAIFGAVYPPDPSILQNYAFMRAELGQTFLSNYRSLVIAVAVAKRTKGVETGLKPGGEFGKDYQPEFWEDESLQKPGSDPERQYVQKIADFLSARQVAALDVYNSDALRKELASYLSSHGIPDNLVAETRQKAPFGERLKYAMVLLGQRPAAREARPTTVNWLRHLAFLFEARTPSTPTVDRKPLPWPLFPIQSAPWPLLMPLEHRLPMSEANYIWEAFQGLRGPDRFHTYGPYRDDAGVIPDELRPSHWFWDAWPDRIVHGGECVPISKGTVDLYSALGKPAMWAGQPGHANLITFRFADGAWKADIEQAFAGGPDVTTAQWYFDEQPGTELHYRDLYYWPFSEYHLGLAFAMNRGLDSYMDTRIAANIYRTLPETERATLGTNLLESTLSINPYNPEIWYRLAEQTSDPMKAADLSRRALAGDGKASEQYYWQTLGEFVTDYAVLSHDPPKNEDDMARVHTFLKTVPGISPTDLAAYSERFVSSEAPDDAVRHDHQLADQGDAYGLMRMGERYEWGDGVAVDVAKAKAFLARSAALGDAVAALQWGELNPHVPANLIKVSASSVYSDLQDPRHLVDGSGLVGAVHDNEHSAATMWTTVERPQPSTPALGLAQSPAWVRFDFERPLTFDSILIWNHNQANLTDRGFKSTRIYGSTDGSKWFPLTLPEVVVLPKADGSTSAEPVSIRNYASDRGIKSVIVAAEAGDGNYGGTCFGLSAVQFVVPQPVALLPARQIKVICSTTFGPDQDVRHLIDGSGLQSGFHDNEVAARTMWHTVERPPLTQPATGLPTSPAWVRFDFANPHPIDQILIWNHNQANLTDRGFKKVRIYGSPDGESWSPLTANDLTDLPRAPGTNGSEPVAVQTTSRKHPLKAVIIAADAQSGNFGGNTYGLSAVRFVLDQ